MNQICGITIFVLIIAVIVLMFVLDRRNRSQLLRQMKQVCAQKGWQFRARPDTHVDCLILGQNGDIHWMLTYAGLEQQSNAPRQEARAEWFNDSVKHMEGTLALSPKLGKLPAIGGLGNLQEMVFDGLMDQLGINRGASTQQTAGSTLFQEKYMALAPDETSVQPLVAAVENQLLNWPHTSNPMFLPIVIADDKGITVCVNRGGMAVDQQVQIAERMVMLGVAAVNAMKE